MNLLKWNHFYSGFCGMALMGIIWFAMSDDSSRLLKISIGEATLEDAGRQHGDQARRTPGADLHG